MADPLSISASLVALITAAVTSVKTLHGTVSRFKGRDKTLGRLQDELEEAITLLNSLNDVVHAEVAMAELLKGPIDRCNKVCDEFRQSMETFGKKSKTGFRDWTKLEFMRGDINEFIDMISGYKSTISVGLGLITMFVIIFSPSISLANLSIDISPKSPSKPCKIITKWFKTQCTI